MVVEEGMLDVPTQKRFARKMEGGGAGGLDQPTRSERWPIIVARPLPMPGGRTLWIPARRIAQGAKSLNVRYRSGSKPTVHFT